MNPQAVNYSSSATVDNGTCDLGPTDYPLVSACSGMCQGMRIVRATQSHEIGGSNYDETWNNLDGICSNYGFRAPTTSSSNGTLWDYNINSSAPLTSDQWNPTWPWMNGSLPNGFIGGRIWVAAGAPEWLSRAIYPSVSAGNSLYSNSGSIQWESYHPLSGGNNQYISSGTIAVGDFVLCGDQNSSMACPASMVESGGSCSNRMDCSQGGASYWYNGSSYADENSCLCASGLGGNCTVSCSDSQYDAGGYCANRMDCSSSGGYYWYNGNQYSDVGSCGSTMCSSQGSPYSHEGSCYGDAASYYAAYCSSMNAPYSSASGCHWDVSSYCSAVGGTVYNGECYSDLSSYCSAQGYDYSYNGQCYDLSGYCMATGYSYSYNGSCYDYAGYCSATGGMYYSGYCYTDVSSYCSASSGYYFDGTCYSDYSSYFQTSCSASGGYPYNNYCYGDHSSYCVAMGYAYGDGSSCYYSNPYSCSGYEYNGTCYSDHSSYCSAQGLSSNGSYCYCSGYDYNGTCYSDHSGYCGAQGMSSDGMNCY